MQVKKKTSMVKINAKNMSIRKCTPQHYYMIKSLLTTQNFLLIMQHLVVFFSSSDDEYSKQSMMITSCIEMTLLGVFSGFA